MSHKHLHLLRTIFQDPVSGNIHWREVESLLHHLGAEVGSYELRVPYSDDRELIMDIMKYGGDCTVVSPQALVKRVAAELERGLKLYQT